MQLTEMSWMLTAELVEYVAARRNASTLEVELMQRVLVLQGMLEEQQKECYDPRRESENSS